jgi:uncharacterized protein YggE
MMRNNKHMTTSHLHKTAALALGVTLLSGASLASPASAAETRYITISATGTTTVVPDAVRINATVSVLGTSSKGALSTAGTTSTALRSALTANKVATKDIVTQSITVYPEYSYPANGTPTLSGYRAAQSFDITIRNATRAGAVVDVIVEAGGDNLQVNGVSPFVLDSDKATAVARTAAVKKAKTKAASYAKLLGVKLGRVIYLNETSTPVAYPIYTATAKADSAETVVDLGEQKVTVSVTVRWSIS